MKPKVISVDLDGVLCKGDYWGKGNPKPIKENIDIINKLSLNNFIIIHTARRYEWALSTLKWLDRNNVCYHAIRFNKMPCDILIDDRSKQIKDFKI